MENMFENFIREEYEWLYNSDDDLDILIGDLENDISMDNLRSRLEDFIERAVDNFCNDEYIIQMMHEWMHDELINVIDSSLED